MGILPSLLCFRRVLFVHSGDIQTGSDGPKYMRRPRNHWLEDKNRGRPSRKEREKPLHIYGHGGGGGTTMVLMRPTPQLSIKTEGWGGGGALAVWLGGGGGLHACVMFTRSAVLQPLTL